MTGFSDIAAYFDHVVKAHVRRRLLDQSKALFRYVCKFDECDYASGKCRSKDALELHVKKIHVMPHLDGDLQMILEGLNNMAVYPTKRKYCDKSRTRWFAGYRSQGQWQTTIGLNPLPMMSVSSMVDYKNSLRTGPGIHDSVLQRMADCIHLIAEKCTDPREKELCHIGVLTFDEKKVRPTAQLKPNLKTEGVKGMIELSDGGMKSATSILQFRWRCIFRNFHWYVHLLYCVCGVLLSDMLGIRRFFTLAVTIRLKRFWK